jgi:hypothetical protein
MLVNHELRILQNNLHKCQSRLHSILNDCDTKQYAILLLQEQYWSLYTESSLRHPSWTLYEPTTRNNEQPRSSIYINNNLLSAAQITHIDLPLSDVTAIELATKDQHLMLIVNVYKPCDKNIIPELHEHLRAKLAARSYVKEMSFFWEVSGTSVQGNQSPRTARLTGLFPDLSGKTSTAQGISGSHQE